MAWVAVDRDGSTFIFEDKPIYIRGKWFGSGGNISGINPKILPFKVTKTNSYEIEIVRK